MVKLNKYHGVMLLLSFSVFSFLICSAYYLSVGQNLMSSDDIRILTLLVGIIYAWMMLALVRRGFPRLNNKDARVYKEGGDPHIYN